MAFVSIALFTGFMAGTGGASKRQEKILSEIPLNISDALSKFNFDSQTTVYAICPSCHFTYKPETKRGSSLLIYLKFCTNKPHPDADVCNEPLLETQQDDDKSNDRSNKTQQDDDGSNDTSNLGSVGHLHGRYES